MDLFKFKPVGGGQVKLEQGEAIIGLKEVMWIERYRDAGEFKLIAPVSSGIRTFLPLGTLISHVDTAEIMVVENHLMKDELDEDTTIEVTGRSFDSFLEQRIAGWSLYWTYKDTTVTFLPQFVLGTGTSAAQASIYIQVAINTDRPAGPSDDQIEWVQPSTRISLPVTYPTYPDRIMKREDVYKGLKGLLELDDLGIRVLRPWVGCEGFDHDNNLTFFLVHDGRDKRNSVTFSWEQGDLQGADYLMSMKSRKTEALVLGRYVDHVVYSTETGLNRREMLVDATDIDEIYDAYPTAPQKVTARNAMEIRGQAELAASHDVEITSINISKTNRYQFRKDYDIGDIVRIDANYGQIRVARVIEYVEIENEDGESGYPTVSIVN